MSQKDWADLELIKSTPDYRAVLGLEHDATSNAEVSHAIFEAGVRAIKEQAEYEIYAQMAAGSEFRSAQQVNRERLQRRGRTIPLD